MARRNDHSKEELKELIFNSAKQIVAKKGYKELTARKLAAKIGYTPGTIYTFYKNIDDLVWNINFSTLSEIYDLICEKLEKVKSPEKQIKFIAEIYVNYSLEQRNFWELLFEYRYKKQNTQPIWYQEKIAEVFSLVENSISGFCKSKKDTQDMAKVLWASLHGIVILSFRSRLTSTNINSIEELVQAFLKNFIKGLKS